MVPSPVIQIAAASDDGELCAAIRDRPVNPPALDREVHAGQIGVTRFVVRNISAPRVRIGGLDPGETKEIRGKIYIVDADVPALVKRYEHDFPEQARSQ